MISTMHDSRWSVLINSSDDSKKRLSSCHLLSCNLQSLTVRVVASCCLCCRRQLPYLVVTSVQLISDFLSSGWTQVAVDKMTSFRCPNFGDVWALSNETLGIWFSIGYSLNLKVDLTVDSWRGIHSWQLLQSVNVMLVHSLLKLQVWHWHTVTQVTASDKFWHMKKHLTHRSMSRLLKLQVWHWHTVTQVTTSDKFWQLKGHMATTFMKVWNC